MADPLFPRQGVPTPEGCANLLFDKILAKNYMKMKEIGRGRIPSTPWIRQCKMFPIGFRLVPLVMLIINQK